MYIYRVCELMQHFCHYVAAWSGVYFQLGTQAHSCVQRLDSRGTRPPVSTLYFSPVLTGLFFARMLIGTLRIEISRRPCHLRIAVPREIKNREYRVALTPAGVRELVAARTCSDGGSRRR